MMSDNDDRIDFTQHLFVTQNAPNTQNDEESVDTDTDMITSQGSVTSINNDIYNVIKEKFEHLDRQSFKSALLENLHAQDMRPVRASLYEIIKRDNDINGRPIERTAREKGPSVEEKTADDIYVMFNFIEGNGTFTELKNCLSRSTCRVTSISTANMKNTETKITEILQKLSTNSENTHSNIASVLIGSILEIKQTITDEMKSVTCKLNVLSETVENEIKSLRISLNTKQKELDLLRA